MEFTFLRFRVSASMKQHRRCYASKISSANGFFEVLYLEFAECYWLRSYELEIFEHLTLCHGLKDQGLGLELLNLLDIIWLKALHY